MVVCFEMLAGKDLSNHFPLKFDSSIGHCIVFTTIIIKTQMQNTSDCLPLCNRENQEENDR